MKNLYLLLIVASGALFFTSCKKDNESSEPKNELLGKWNGVKVIEAIFKNGVEMESSTTNLVSPQYFIIEFKSGNNAEIKSTIDGEVLNETLYYKVVGNKLHLDESSQFDDSEIFTFSISGKNLTLKAEETEEYQGATYKYTRELYFTR